MDISSDNCNISVSVFYTIIYIGKKKPHTHTTTTKKKEEKKKYN
jgi:hypothetical protein